MTPDEMFQQANEFHRTGRLDEAAALYDQLLAQFPTHADTLHLRGVIELRRERIASAIELFDRALAANPGHADAGRARAAAIEALAEDHVAEAVKLLHARSPVDALAACEKALAIAPRLFDALFAQASILRALGQTEKAIAACVRALEINPDSADVLVLRGLIFKDAKQPERALADFEGALDLDPDMDLIAGESMLLSLQTCDWEAFEQRTAALLDAVDAGRTGVQPFVLTLLPSSPAQQRKAAAQYFAANNPVLGERASQQRRPGSKLRIGYFSSDFHDHPTAQLMVDLLAAHDRSQFEIVAFAFGGDVADKMRGRVAKACDQFIDVAGSKDTETARLAREKQIHIAVDLNGYTASSRPGIFAAGAAPVQVNYLGYPGTLGSDRYDYIIGDHTVTPPRHHADFAERVVTMPHSYQPNTAATRIAAARPTPRTQAGLPEDGFVYCCFNSVAKITPDVFDIWMRLLKAVDGSVLWLLEGSPAALRNLRREAKDRGVASERLVFAPRAPAGVYLARYLHADLFLDTFHYNAHTTGSDALLMGVPVVTRCGDAFAGRVGASLLRAVGVPELITETTADYERLALRLATEPDFLQHFRAHLREGAHSSPLFDTKRYARNLEAAYREMWSRNEAGLPPAHIQVTE